MESQFEYFHRLFREAQANTTDPGEIIFERITIEFETLHGFKSPYSSYQSFKVMMSRKHNERRKALYHIQHSKQS